MDKALHEVALFVESKVYGERKELRAHNRNQIILSHLILSYLYAGRLMAIVGQTHRTFTLRKLDRSFCLT